MTLPSQFARQTSRHNHMFRRRRGGRKAFVGALLGLLVAVIVVWRFTGSSDSPASAQASLDQPQQTTEPAQTPPEAVTPPAEQSRRSTRVTTSAPDPSEPQIQMGAPLASTNTEAESTPAPRTSQSARETETRQQSAPRESRQSRATEPSSTQRESARSERDNRTASPGAERARERMRIGLDLLASNRPIEGRRVLTQALETDGIRPSDARQIRQRLTELNERLVFSPEVVADDPYAFGYSIRPGDALARLPRAQNLATDWRLIQRVNRIQRPQAIRAGQNIKLVTGPFHAIVYKRQYRMDIYLGEGADRVYVRSFPVGLGEYDSTPIGTFMVRPNSKLINPEWTNPRTGQRFLPDDPNNPIGDYWIGLIGVSEGIQDLGGYGIHGTIEPESIGQQASMGCIRLLDDDVALVYELLVEDHSTIEIVDE